MCTPQNLYSLLCTFCAIHSPTLNTQIDYFRKFYPNPTIIRPSTTLRYHWHLNIPSSIPFSTSTILRPPPHQHHHITPLHQYPLLPPNTSYPSTTTTTSFSGCVPVLLLVRHRILYLRRRRFIRRYLVPVACDAGGKTGVWSWQWLAHKFVGLA